MSAATLLAVAGLLADVQEIPPEDQTSPGLLGFLVTFAVAAAVIGLGFSLVKHLRVVDRNARRLEAEEAAQAAEPAPAPAPTVDEASPAQGTADPSAPTDAGASATDPGASPADPR